MQEEITGRKQVVLPGFRRKEAIRWPGRTARRESGYSEYRRTTRVVIAETISYRRTTRAVMVETIS